MQRRVAPFLAAEAALRLELAKPWEVAAALQAVWLLGEAASEDAFAQALARSAGLDAAALERLRAEVTCLRAQSRPDATGGGASRPSVGQRLQAIVAGDPTGTSRTAAGSGARVPVPLRTVPESRYVDFTPAGAGGMGIVYWALDTEMNRQVAFKIVRPDAGVADHAQPPTTPIHASPPGRGTPASVAFQELKARFLQEAWVTGGLEHPGIVPVYEMGQTPDGVPYYTMRFVRGRRTLATAIQDARGQPIARRLELLEPFLKVCDTVAYAHSRRVVHRDLKPANVALGEFGEVVLLDWGLARIRGASGQVPDSLWRERIEGHRKASALATQAMVGTPGYMAPEAVRGQPDDVSELSDVYSLGVMLFELLTGRLPFEVSTVGEWLVQVTSEDAPQVRTLSPDVPEVLNALCGRALARDPLARPVGAGALAAAVREWRTQAAIEAEIDSLLKEAHAHLAAARELEGAALLGQVERAAGACEQVLRRAPGHPVASALRVQLGELREAGLRAREQAGRRRALRRAGVAALVLATVATVAVAKALDDKRRDAEAAQREAVAARGVAEESRREAENARSLAQAEQERAEAEATQARADRARAGAAEQAALLDAERARKSELAAAEASRRADADAAEAKAQRQAAERTLGILSRLMGVLDADMGDEQRERWSGVYLAGLKLALEAGNTDDAFFFFERARADPLLDQLRPAGRVEMPVPPALARAEEEVRKREVAAMRVYREAVSTGNLQQMRAARDALRVVQGERQLAVLQITRLMRAMAEDAPPAPPTAVEIQKLLPPGHAYVAYAVLPDQIVALLITPAQARIVSMGPRQPVEAALSLLDPSNREDSKEAAGSEAAVKLLRAGLIAPLALPQDCTTLLVSPEGPLLAAPFCLLAPDQDVAFIPSGSVYRALMRRVSQRGQEVLAVGDADLASTPGGPGRFPRLLGTRIEVEKIGTVRLLGGEATERRLKELLAQKPRWRAIHLACHGVLDKERPLQDALILAGDEDEDGWLSALDVTQLTLAVDLVSLGACESGLGEILQGGGIGALTRAFLFAGATRVLVAQSKVDDEASSALMVRFYELWDPRDGAAPVGAAAALRAAQEHVRSQPRWAHPRYWAFWVLWGTP